MENTQIKKKQMENTQMEIERLKADVHHLRKQEITYGKIFQAIKEKFNSMKLKLYMYHVDIVNLREEITKLKQKETETLPPTDLTLMDELDGKTVQDLMNVLFDEDEPENILFGE